MASEQPQGAAGAVYEAVEGELSKMAEHVRASGLAASALKLAAILDATSAARDSAALGRELRATLAELHQVDDSGPTWDPLQEMLARRAERVAADVKRSVYVKESGDG